MMVKSMSGQLIPIKQLVSRELKSAPPPLQHQMTERMARITADLRISYQADPVTNSIIEKPDQYP